MRPQTRTVPGLISVYEVYALDELKLRMRWTDASLRSARRKGLKILSHGKRRYVSGRDVLKFLREHAP
jgi:hypothetical protein